MGRGCFSSRWSYFWLCSGYCSLCGNCLCPAQCGSTGRFERMDVLGRDNPEGEAFLLHQLHDHARFLLVEFVNIISCSESSQDLWYNTHPRWNS